MDDIIDQLSLFVEGVIQDIDHIDDDEFDQIMNFLQQTIGALQTNQQEQQRPVEPPIPLGADLLWKIAGGDPEAFISYLRTVPDPHLNVVARNENLLRQTIQQLQQQYPRPEPEVQAGIEKAPLQSSNIWGFHYNPRSGHLLVRFQGGPVYAYEGVPPGVFQIFRHGAIPAKTSGQNAYGSWWQGKIPSLGAAFYEMIRNGGYPYERVA